MGCEGKRGLGEKGGSEEMEIVGERWGEGAKLERS